ncbi:MAG: methyltransferase [Phycisphaerales bacterium]|nr:methyltransferase [Phycisphaerales bacterium]
MKNPLTRLIIRSYETARNGPVRRLHRAWCGSARWSHYHFGMHLTGNNTGFYFDLTTLLLKWVIQRRWDHARIKRGLEIGVGESANLAGYFSRFGRIHFDAVDLREREVETARKHVALNGVDVTVFQSDVFSNVPAAQYDLVFWNLPYRVPPEHYLPALFRGCRGYLAPRGELIIGYNASPLPRSSVLQHMSDVGGLQLLEANTWWWNPHDVLVIGHARRAGA